MKKLNVLLYTETYFWWINDSNYIDSKMDRKQISHIQLYPLTFLMCTFAVMFYPWSDIQVFGSIKAGGACYG